MSQYKNYSLEPLQSGLGSGGIVKKLDITRSYIRAILTFSIYTYPSIMEFFNRKIYIDKSHVIIKGIKSTIKVILIINNSSSYRVNI